METQADRLRQARTQAGFKKASDAIERFGWARGTYYGHENGARGLTAEAAREYGRAFRVPPDWLLWGGQRHRAPVPVAGKVGAGAHVELVDAYAKGAGMYHVEAPADIDPRDVVAVEVDGESMAPLIPPGSVLLFSRQFETVEPADLGRVVICETENGRAWVKQIRPGREPGTFDLYSANAGSDPIYGQRVKWAARLRRMIPPEDVTRIDEMGAA